VDSGNILDLSNFAGQNYLLSHCIGAPLKTIYQVLNSINWSSIIYTSADNVQQLYLYDEIIGILLAVIHNYVPDTAKKKIKKPICIIRLLKEKQQALIAYNKNMSNSSLKLAYKAKSKQYDQCVKQWYDQLEGSICSNPNPAKFYGQIVM